MEPDAALDNNYTELLSNINALQTYDKFEQKYDNLLFEKRKAYSDVDLFHTSTINMLRNGSCYQILYKVQLYRDLWDNPEVQDDMDRLIGFITDSGNITCAIEWARKVGTHLKYIANYILNVGDISYVLEWTSFRNEYFDVMQEFYYHYANVDDLIDWIIVHKDNIDKCYSFKNEIILYHCHLFRGVDEYRGLRTVDLFKDMPGEYDLGVML